MLEHQDACMHYFCTEMCKCHVSCSVCFPAAMPGIQMGNPVSVTAAMPGIQMGNPVSVRKLSSYPLFDSERPVILSPV